MGQQVHCPSIAQHLERQINQRNIGFYLLNDILIPLFTQKRQLESQWSLKRMDMWCRCYEGMLHHHCPYGRATTDNNIDTTDETQKI